jgi:MFS family permease
MAPIALAFGVLELGGSAGDLGLVLTLSILPQVFFLLAGGVIADRLPRHIVMVASNLVSGAAQAVAAVLLISGAAEIWQLAVVAVVRAVASSFFFPAQQGIIPQTVPVELLQPANALLRLTLNATNIGGAALGGLIVAAAGPGWALAFDAFTYVAAAALLLPMHIVPPARAATESFFAELREGWAAFSSRTWLWVVVLGFAFSNGAQSAALNVLGPIVAEESLGGAKVWGLILAALVVGGLIALRIHPARPLLLGVCAAVLLVPPVVLLALEAPWQVIALAALFTGLGIELFSVFWDLSLQGHVPNELLSRVSTWDALGSFVLMPAAYAIVGPASEAFGITDALGLCRGRDRRTRRPARLAGGAGAAAPRSAARGSAGGGIARSWKSAGRSCTINRCTSSSESASPPTCPFTEQTRSTARARRA